MAVSCLGELFFHLSERVSDCLHSAIFPDKGSSEGRNRSVSDIQTSLASFNVSISGAQACLEALLQDSSNTLDLEASAESQRDKIPLTIDEEEETEVSDDQLEGEEGDLLQFSNAAQ